MQKTQRLILFLGLLSIAAYLRISGLSWGLSSGYGHDLNFQPDEFVSLRGVFELDLLRGRIKAPGAYFEGTFNYYLWALPEAVLRAAPAEDVPFTDSTSMTRYSSLLYICRWMSILFDLCTIVVVFLGIKEATQMFYPALVGALCYSVLPMQVIYAHFMRTHILSNLLCALVIWFSLKLRQSLRWQLLFTVGIISGLAAATRYPVGIIVVIPCFYLLLNRDDSRSKPSGIWERVRVLLIGHYG
ncbi:MAG TPA: glycosyltransferase family 39 protein [Nitrososphaera sp.]|nr:glycosyltransferase family 39 protein [Nitrososphaera sp.]